MSNGFDLDEMLYWYVLLWSSVIGQYGRHHAKRDLGTYAKSVDPDQPPRLRRSVWSGSSLFYTPHINGTYFSCYVNNSIMYRCFQHRIGTDLGLHYVKCPKVPGYIIYSFSRSIFSQNTFESVSRGPFNRPIWIITTIESLTVIFSFKYWNIF